MGEQAMAEAARNREVEQRFRVTAPLPIKLGANSCECPCCGRKWRIRHGLAAGAFGFIWAAAENHVRVCAVATPAERGAITRIDLRRWKSRPPRHVITINWEHPGMKGGSNG